MSSPADNNNNRESSAAPAHSPVRDDHFSNPSHSAIDVTTPRAQHQQSTSHAVFAFSQSVVNEQENKRDDPSIHSLSRSLQPPLPINNQRSRSASVNNRAPSSSSGQSSAPAAHAPAAEACRATRAELKEEDPTLKLDSPCPLLSCSSLFS